MVNIIRKVRRFSSMRPNANGRARHVKGDELRLEEDVAVDLEVGAAVGLDCAEAVCDYVSEQTMAGF
jgi:hypothetical protein